MPAFETVIRGAQRQEGALVIWKRDDKVWIELSAEDFERPFFLSSKLATGIGEAQIYAGLMAGSRLVGLRRVHNQIQLLARNAAFVARADASTAGAVAAAYSPSLLGSAPVASQPHPQRGTVLVEATPLLVSDMLGLGMRLQRSYRQSYAFDARNSALTTARSSAAGVVFEVLGHFAAPSLTPAQPAASPGSPGAAPAASLPTTVPDPRSLFITVHHSLTPLPREPMAPRRADPRVGHFVTMVSDFSDDLTRSPQRYYVNRWRIEKKDPLAAVSEPVRPLTYWLDRSIPPAYRAPITQGILAWNEAFERIGFKNAIVVREQPADGSVDTLETDHASVRWMTNQSRSFDAIAPSHVDPRSGEILDANVAIESLGARAVRAQRAQLLPPDLLLAAHLPHADGDGCELANQAGDALAFGLDVLAARGELDPDGPEARRYVADYLRYIAMHEIGHTLGLRHNFRGSRAYTAAQLADPAFVQAHGSTASVMDYLPVLLAQPVPASTPQPAPTEPGPGSSASTTGHEVQPFPARLGPYDFWAIEYAYKPLPPEAESAALITLAARSQQPEWQRLLAFGTDEDYSLGIDPEALPFDSGDDALAYARQRLAIARDLLARLQTRPLDGDEDYGALRRGVNHALADLMRTATVLTRQVGGVHTLRDYPGSGRDPLQPVPAPAQRDALALLASGYLSADSLALPPALLRRLAPDYLERGMALARGAQTATDYSYAQVLLTLQRLVLTPLLSPEVTLRLLDSADKDNQALSPAELHARLSRAIWSELAGSRSPGIPALRRNLQREHVNQLSGLLLRASSLTGRADGRSALLQASRSLLGQLQAAQQRSPAGSAERAHLADCAETLARALDAGVQRSTP